jgi:uncharacterized protein (TIGR02391 family)
VTQGLFNDGISSFMTILEDAPYQVSVEHSLFEPDQEINIFTVEAINSRKHSQVKNARFGLTYDAVRLFRQGYDKNTREIEQLIARRFVQWATENPGAITPEPDELLLITSEDIAPLAGERVAKDIAEAQLARFLLDAFRGSNVSVFNLQDLFVSTRLQRDDLYSAVDFFHVNGINIIQDSSGTLLQMKLNPANRSEAETIAARLSTERTVSRVARPVALESKPLHPMLETASGRLLADGHFAQAVFTGCLALCELVRNNTGLTTDGTSLMETAFSAENPRLPVNAGVTRSDKDEQQGFMRIFSGAMLGIRNPRGHVLNEDSPERALAYLQFLSLLFDIVDEAAARNSTANTTPSP